VRASRPAGESRRPIKVAGLTELDSCRNYWGQTAHQSLPMAAPNDAKLYREQDADTSSCRLRRLTPAVCQSSSAKLAFCGHEREANFPQTNRWFQQHSASPRAFTRRLVPTTARRGTWAAGVRRSSSRSPRRRAGPPPRAGRVCLLLPRRGVRGRSSPNPHTSAHPARRGKLAAAESKVAGRRVLRLELGRRPPPANRRRPTPGEGGRHLATPNLRRLSSIHIDSSPIHLRFASIRR
jgi:hypothetical protein